MMPANLVFDEQSPRGLQTVILLLCPHMEKRKKEREIEREGVREREREREREKGGSGLLFLIMTQSHHRKFPPKDPSPRTITLGVKASSYGF